MKLIDLDPHWLTFDGPRATRFPAVLGLGEVKHWPGFFGAGGGNGGNGASGASGGAAATNGTAPGGGGGGSGPDMGSVISGSGARGQISFAYT